MSDPENTGPTKDEFGRFLPGVSGNPAGKPKGARTKLGEQFLSALQEDFQAHGVAAIQAVRAVRPHEYLKVIASLMPKDLNLNVNNMDDATDAELVQRLRDLESVIRPFLAAERSGDGSDGIGKATAH